MLDKVISDRLPHHIDDLDVPAGSRKMTASMRRAVVILVADHHKRLVFAGSRIIRAENADAGLLRSSEDQSGFMR